VIQTLALLHRVGANALLIFAVVLAVWGTYQYFRRSAVSGGFRSSYLIMAGLSVVQGVLGLGAFALGARPGGQLLHFVYGIFAVVFLPGAYLYARSGNARREALILAGAAWIVSVAFFRGISTG
jgi:heme A synthase